MYAFNTLSVASTIPCAWVDVHVGRGPIYTFLVTLCFGPLENGYINIIMLGNEEN